MTSQRCKLYDIAKVVRSKNAGPFYITLDVIFATREESDHVQSQNVLTAAWISRMYGIDEKDVRVIPYPPAHAVKITIPRDHSCGSPEDTDVYGAQQHGPLIDLEVEPMPA
jgi:hypothetical protein